MGVVRYLPVFYIEVPAGRAIKLTDPVLGTQPAAIHEGVYAATRCEKPGWLLVEHPEKGKLGLPLHGMHSSWFAAWNNEDVEISLSKPGREWRPIEDWNELAGIKL
jgi:hypothetical protein